MKAMKLIAMLGLLIGLSGALTSRAAAQCGLSLQHGRPVFTNAPLAADAKDTAPKGTLDNDAGASTIVGLWDVKFISENQVIDEGFDQYHSDGLEILNDTPPPATGNVCLGVYEKTGARAIKLKHPSWIYDSTNTTIIGRATILENVKLDKGGRTFTGTFTIQLRDLSGNPLAPDITGELTADRITP
jgi:hypothetical protein